MRNLQVVMMAMVVAVTGLSMPSARAQGINLAAPEKPVTWEEIEKKEAQEKAYKDSLRKIPDQNVVRDPWGDVRNAGTPAAGKPPPKTR
jgi:hypothetical protein